MHLCSSDVDNMGQKLVIFINICMYIKQLSCFTQESDYGEVVHHLWVMKSAVICKNQHPALVAQSQALALETECKASGAKWTDCNYYSYCQSHYCKVGGQRA